VFSLAAMIGLYQPAEAVSFEGVVREAFENAIEGQLSHRVEMAHGRQTAQTDGSLTHSLWSLLWNLYRYQQPTSRHHTEIRPHPRLIKDLLILLKTLETALPEFRLRRSSEFTSKLPKTDPTLLGAQEHAIGSLSPCNPVIANDTHVSKT